MQQITIQNNLSAIHLGESSPLYPLIQARSKRSQENVVISIDSLLWDAQWWGLNDAPEFNELPEQQQQQILIACNQTVLNEAYFIEKSGLAYTAKMVLLAESTDIAQLYALIGADEARHLAWIEPYILEEDKQHPRGEFLIFLSKLIEEAPPNLLVYLVQIILEGWGLDHYQKLAQGCTNAELGSRLTQIVKDEALHHKSGHLIFNASRLSIDEQAFILQAMKRYASMVQVGPLTALAAIDQVLGGLPRTQLESLFTSLRHPQESLRKLELLKNLMHQPGMEKAVGQITQEGYFIPLSIEASLDLYLSERP